MNEHTTAIIEIKEYPRRQVQLFLQWFQKIGTQSFDIHLKSPTSDTSFKTTGKKHYWLTHHENLSSKQVEHLWPWLRHMNAHGADIYFRPHRNYEHSALFLDDLSMAKARKVAAKYACAVVSTSHDNTQLWLGTTRPLPKEERKNAQKYLSDLGYSDPGSVSGDHLGRLPGFFSQKRNVWVNAVFFSSAQYYQSQNTSAVPHMAMRARRRAPCKGNLSQSEREFGWVMEMLRNGSRLDFVTSHLTRTAEQRGKRNPEYYANLTIRNALKEFHKVV